MRKEEVDWVAHNIIASNLCVEGSKWYLFGSVTKVGVFPADIDILVIYKDTEMIEAIRRNISHVELQRPLDLIFMNDDEVTELGFIDSEKCIQIFPKNELRCSGDKQFKSQLSNQVEQEILEV